MTQVQRENLREPPSIEQRLEQQLFTELRFDLRVSDFKFLLPMNCGRLQLPFSVWSDLHQKEIWKKMQHSEHGENYMPEGCTIRFSILELLKAKRRKKTIGGIFTNVGF